MALRIRQSSGHRRWFVIGEHGDRAKVLKLYRTWLRDMVRTSPKFRRQFLALADAPALVCCCKPKRCHGDVMVELLAELTGEESDV